MWWVIVILVVAGGSALYLLKGRKREDVVPQDTFICDVCGERDCICHKEEKK